jgi:sec-independent protein translocase protein TatA
MGTIGLWGIIAVVAVIVLLYGAKRLPDLARSLGRSSREFKDALSEAPEEFRDGMNEGEIPEREAVEPGEAGPERVTAQPGPTAREVELERELEAERARRREAGTTSGTDT